MRPNSRFTHVQPFDIDRVAAEAGADPDVLRLENLDTDVPPPPAAVEATRRSLEEGTGNSWLPFTGLPELREAVADDLRRRTGLGYDPLRQITITSGGTSAVMPVLLATTEPGDPVVLTDPTYAGLLQRVRLSGASPPSRAAARPRRPLAARPRGAVAGADGGGAAADEPVDAVRRGARP
ncbi:aminotransferase class I/II-fold pyridoxal phosphate-dependent enzyme [Nonomuraea salmonea]|uniref:aminotransferase class I/II-fold pyridoxal phosphate-dependent enzyme n=1 Tax=Nonomuraea salmonea TaxID=46181 RepID=UPI002FEB5924